MRTRLKTHNVQVILTRRCISQNNLARRLKVTKGYLSQLMAGTRFPSPDLRTRIMEELKVDFDELFTIEPLKSTSLHEATKP
jgi:transcriptional regulator with XRE-family HTH domain